METRYDSYYKKEIPYKMSLEELADLKYKRKEDILACLRQLGIDNARVIIPFSPINNIMRSIFPNVALYSSKKIDTICKIINEDDPIYNPLVEKDIIHSGHWFHPYKIKFTPIGYKRAIEQFYFSDFCSMLNRGHAKIIRTLNFY